MRDVKERSVFPGEAMDFYGFRSSREATAEIHRLERNGGSAAARTRRFVGSRFFLRLLGKLRTPERKVRRRSAALGLLETADGLGLVVVDVENGVELGNL